MDPIEELRRKRAEVNQKVQALAAAEQESGELTAEQLAEFDSLKAEFDQLSQRMERAEQVERMQAAAAQPVRPSANNAPAVHIKPELKQYPGASAARMVMSIAAGGGNLTDAVKFARNEIGDMDVAMAMETGGGSGGALVPDNMHDEVIELLRPRTSVPA